MSSGTFAINVSLSPIAGFACRLAMIPAGSGKTGAAAAPFTGPAISVSDQFSHSSQGSLFGYYVLSGTLPWSFAFQSLGDCPVTSSFATDTSTLGSFSLFVGNACLPKSSGVGTAAGTRSSLQIDGLNAYAPAAISALASQPGFQQLSYGALFNASHDTVDDHRNGRPDDLQSAGDLPADDEHVPVAARLRHPGPADDPPAPGRSGGAGDATLRKRRRA